MYTDCQPILNPLTEKLASPTVTNSHKAEIPACRSLIYSCKAEISAWKFQKKLLKIMCLGALGLWTHAVGVQGERVSSFCVVFPQRLQLLECPRI